jgi:hypothetical protein
MILEILLALMVVPFCISCFMKSCVQTLPGRGFGGLRQGGILSSDVLAEVQSQVKGNSLALFPH